MSSCIARLGLCTATAPARGQNCAFGAIDLSAHGRGVTTLTRGTIQQYPHLAFMIMGARIAAEEG